MADQDFPGAGVDQVPFLPEEQQERFLTVKGSIETIGVRPECRANLENFVRLHHWVTMHTYRLLKFIIMHMINDDRRTATEYISTKFISEVYQKLITKRPGGRPPERDTLIIRARIDQYLPHYLQLVNIQQEDLPRMLYSQQTSIYEAVKIKTAYLNNVRNNFGNRLRQAVNVLLRLNERKRQRRAELEALGVVRRQITTIIRQETTNPATNFKEALRLATTVEELHIHFNQDQLFTNAINQLAPVLNSYPPRTAFQENNRYYDCKANPQAHFKAFYRLAELFVRLEIRPFCVCPLRRSFVPGCVTMDTKIVKTKIFVENVRQGDNLRHHHEWGRFVDFRLPIFRGEGQAARRVHFGNMIQTDGVGVSVLKRGQWHNQFNPQQAERQGQEAREFPYITDPEANLPQENCVVIDPGRRDLLYCMHETSTVENPNMFRFTKPMQDKIRKTRRYRRILQDLKPERIGQLERRLVNSNSLLLPLYMLYLNTFGEVHRELLEFYATTRGQGLEHQFPIHRKLRLSAVIKKSRCDALLVRWLQQKFPNATFVMGNWSAPMARYHEPIRGKGFRRLLRKNGLNVLLIDEYLTSQVCPQCHQQTLEPFRRRRNPRPYRQGLVTVHGLLRCTNRFHPGHGIDYEYRLFNRDTAAGLNMIRILVQQRANGQRPPDLARPPPAAPPA